MSSEIYEKYTDGELIALVRGGDSSAEEYLIKRYFPLVMKEINFLFMAGAEKDDIFQEGMLGLFKAVRDYDPGRDAKFSTFALMCVRRQIKTAVTAANRKKNIPLNSYISLDNDPESDDEMSFEPASDKLSPEKAYIEDEYIRELEMKIDTLLSPMERKVVKLYIYGHSGSDIAEMIGRSEQSVSNTLYRARSKLRAGKESN